jgi:hypothetical protein
MPDLAGRDKRRIAPQQKQAFSQDYRKDTHGIFPELFKITYSCVYLESG